MKQTQNNSNKTDARYKISCLIPKKYPFAQLSGLSTEHMIIGLSYLGMILQQNEDSNYHGYLLVDPASDGELK